MVLQAEQWPCAAHSPSTTIDTSCTGRSSKSGHVSNFHRGGPSSNLRHPFADAYLDGVNRKGPPDAEASSRRALASLRRGGRRIRRGSRNETLTTSTSMTARQGMGGRRRRQVGSWGLGLVSTVRGHKSIPSSPCCSTGGEQV